MKKFLTYIGLLSGIITVLYIIGFAISIHSNDVDNIFPRTVKFMTEKHPFSIIAGSSRAGQAGDPFSLSIAENFYNTAFSNTHSPFNSAYVNGIKNFTDWNDSTNRITLIEVNPWTIRTAENKPENPGEEYFNLYNPEEGYLSLWRIFINDIGLGKSFRSLFYEDVQKIDEGGRLRVEFDSFWMYNNQSASLKKKINAYKNSPEFMRGHVSDYRIKNLEELIGYGKKHGRVVMLRFPISNEMLEIEDQMHPGFNREMSEIAGKAGIEYLDLTVWNHRFSTTDGNHIWNTDVPRFSKMLNDSIKGK